MSEGKKWDGREPRDIPQHRPGRRVWCYADRRGLDIVSDGAIARITWSQLRRLLRDFGKPTP